MSEDELLAQVYASPDDDGPRLVYADWLTAKGDPRGEFILLQCRLAATPDDEARRKLKVAENKLLKQHGMAWTASLPSRVIKYVFRRGFVDEIEVGYRALEDADALFDAAPLLRSLRLDSTDALSMMVDPRPSLKGLLASRRLEGLTSLDVRVIGLGDAGIQDVAAADHLKHLRSLRMSGLNSYLVGVPIGFDALEALATSDSLRNLTKLDLSDNHLSNIMPLVQAKWPLEWLELGNDHLPAESVRQIARGARVSPARSGEPLGKLRHLGLATAVVDDTTLEGLVSSTTLTSLESLDLERCHIGGGGVTKLFKALTLPKLKTLRLERNGLGEAGALALASSPNVARLTSLEMGHNRIGKKGAKALASSPHLAKLERLLLNEPRWKDETIDLFRQSTTLARCHIYMRGHLLARD